jgi:hypothetical protein
MMPRPYNRKAGVGHSSLPRFQRPFIEVKLINPALIQKNGPAVLSPQTPFEFVGSNSAGEFTFGMLTLDRSPLFLLRTAGSTGNRG